MIQLVSYLLCVLLAILHISEAQTGLISNDSWHCIGEESIPLTKLCDGKVDCSNGSDETTKACLSNLCKDNQYRCAYGACIPAEMKCDKQIDCNDRSDETGFLCDSDDDIWAKMQGICTTEEYQCLSGECIDVYAMCDGLPDCSDGSDESIEACAHSICPAAMFRCGYGACIRLDQVCNKIWDCIDGSDELCHMSAEYDDQPVRELLSTSSSNTCYIPYENLHLQVKQVNTNRILSYYDKILQDEIVEFECSAGYVLDGVDRLTCVDNNWYRQWPNCTIPKTTTSERTPCAATEISCANGKCIERAALCNGIKDCPDGTDETALRCFGNSCTANEYQCKYGACIPDGKLCDKEQHCADGSDETQLLCTKDDDEYLRIVYGKCGIVNDEELAACRSGECIQMRKLCDGIPNCSDHSDESVEMCAAAKCPNSHFKCAYGACAPISALCNGRWDCADGSDEMRSLCEKIEAERAKLEEELFFDDSYEANIDKIEAMEEDRLYEARKSKEEHNANSALGELNEANIHMDEQYFRKCIIPADRVALRAVSTTEQVTLKVGSQVDIGSIVSFSCKEPWQLAGKESELLCMPSGKWSANVPKCEKLCPPQLNGISTTAVCIYKNQEVNCGTYNKPGTKTIVQCAPGYKSTIQQQTVRHCGVDAEWDAPRYNCRPLCMPLTSEEKSPRNETMVNIIKLDPLMSPKVECKGSIISPKLVLTLAVCFSTTDSEIEVVNDPSQYAILSPQEQVMTFKTFDPNKNKHDIANIIFADVDDVDSPAIVVLANYFDISPLLSKPICLQFSYSCLDREKDDIPPALANNMQGIAFSMNHCFAVVGQTKLIYMEKYRPWLQINIFSYNYLL